jgi:hypothetical protein
MLLYRNKKKVFFILEKMSSANSELFDDSEANPFDVEQYIERLAWRTGAGSESNFDPQKLYDEFSSHISGKTRQPILRITHFSLSLPTNKQFQTP